MTVVLFWDIDGTLLHTGRAGILAWEGAAAEVVGHPVDLATLETAGLTDVEIARRIVERLGMDPTPARQGRLLSRYEALLPGSLGRRVGQVLPGVREVLDFMRNRPDVVSLLLTGNIRAGAQAKLAHYGLTEYFVDGAFADGHPDRPSIARAALALARRVAAERVDRARLYVIGDTPHDISCARAIDARAIAIASGVYSADELRRHDPWWVMERLPEPDPFLRRLQGTRDDSSPPR